MKRKLKAEEHKRSVSVLEKKKIIIFSDTDHGNLSWS